MGRHTDKEADGLVVLQVMRWPDMRMNLIASRIWDMNDMEVEIAAQRTKVAEGWQPDDEARASVMTHSLTARGGGLRWRCPCRTCDRGCWRRCGWRRRRRTRWMTCVGMRHAAGGGVQQPRGA